jgi:hypothetical protein
MSGCAAGGLIYSSTVQVPLIMRCVVYCTITLIVAGGREAVVVVYCQGVQLRARSTVLR